MLSLKPLGRVFKKHRVQTREDLRVFCLLPPQILLLLETILILVVQEFSSTLGELRGSKDRLNSVVISCWYRIKLVIVTFRALQRMPKEDLTDTVGHIVKKTLPRDLRHLHSGQLPRPHAQESKSDHRIRLGKCIRILGKPFVARDLLDNELIKRFISIETPDDVIPIPPSVASLKIISKAG